MTEGDKQNTSKKWSADDIKQFLEVYEEHPCLWNHKIPSYKDKSERYKALKKIVEVMSETVEDFDVNAAKSKIRSIRNAYTLEYHKVLASYNSSTSTHAIYTPRVKWYVVADRFLKGIVETKKTKNTSAETLTLNKEEEIIIKEEVEEEYFHSQGDLGAEENTIDDTFANPNFSSDANTPITNSDKRSSKKRPLGKKDKPYRKKEAIADVEHINGAVNALQDIVNRVANYSETIDEFEVFGRTVAAHLRQLPLNEALESQSEILSYLVQRRLGGKKNLYS